MMKRFFSYMCLAAVCIWCLCGCQSTDSSMSTQQQDTTVTTTAETDVTAQTADTSAWMVADRGETILHILPYTFSPGLAAAVYTGPGYIYSSAQAMGQTASYTIVEETQDTQGNLWGKLDGDAGWIDLTQLVNQTPLTVCFAEDIQFRAENYHEYIVDGSDGMVQIAFCANEMLTDVRFVSLIPKGTSYLTEKTLYTLESLAPQMPLVIGVVYYGDMTTYGLSFTDASGNARHYAVYMSGMDGSLILEPFEPV